MSRRVISDQQFAEMATDGASRHLETKEQGPRGYYVSRDPNIPVSEGGGIEMQGGVPSEVDVRAHRKEALTSGAIKETDPEKSKQDVHQGIWSESKEGPTYLDISDRYGRYSEALTRGAMGSQLSIARVTAKRDKEGDQVATIIPTSTEDESGVRTPNPSALMQASMQRKREVKSRRQRRMTRGQRREALESMDKDVRDVREALG